MKRVLGTGGTGHLGKHIVECLSEKNYEVSILTSRKTMFPRDNVSIFKGDLSKNTGLAEAAAEADMIIYCASNSRNFEEWILAVPKIY